MANADTQSFQCDETHPTCNNCSKRGTSCIFGPENMTPGPSFPCTPQSNSQEDSQLVRDEEFRRQYQNSPTASTGDYSPYDSSLSPSLLPPRGSSQLLEMRLLHNCSTVTFSTMYVFKFQYANRRRLNTNSRIEARQHATVPLKMLGRMKCFIWHYTADHGTLYSIYF
jgi:hypothetical protein